MVLVGRSLGRRASAVEIDPIGPAVAIEKDDAPQVRSGPERGAELQPSRVQRCRCPVDRAVEGDRERALRSKRGLQVEQTPA